MSSKKKNPTTDLTKAKVGSVTAEGKVVTKYDKKMAAKAAEEKKDKRNSIIAKSILAACLAAIVITCCVFGFRLFYRVNIKFIAVGSDNVSEKEFDYYYGLSKSSILNTTYYGSYTYATLFSQLYGYDTSKKDSAQSYGSGSDTTFYDYFASAAANQIQEIKALLLAASEEGFEYSTADSDYEDYMNDLRDAASSEGVSTSKYIKSIFGDYASESGIKKYVMDSLKAEAYLNDYNEKNAATDDEIKAYYEANKDTYDQVSYRTFTVKTANTADETYDAVKSMAAEFLSGVTDETSFAEQCRLYCTSDNASTYESDDASLVNSVTSSSMSTGTSDWLLSDDRIYGDTTIIYNDDDECAYILYYISKSYDGSYDTSIASTILSNKYDEFIAPYLEKYPIENTDNRIKLLES